jgi:hypothetical protein
MYGIYKRMIRTKQKRIILVTATSATITAQLLLLLLLLIVHDVTALPTLLVDSGKPKCVTVEGPRDTVLRVQYEAPGT